MKKANNCLLALALISSLSQIATAHASEILTGDTNNPEISTFASGSNIQLLFHASGLMANDHKRINYQISDEFGKQISSTSVWINADGNGNASISVSAPASKLGYYRVDAALDGGTKLSGAGTRPAGFMSYAVVPDPASRIAYSPQLSHFGLQMNATRFQTNSPLPYLGVRWVFGMEDGWSGLEPDYAGEFLVTHNAVVKEGGLWPGYDAGQESLFYGGKPYTTYVISPFTRASTPVWARGADSINDFHSLNAAGLKGIENFASAFAPVFAQLFPNQSQRYYQITWEPQIQPSWTNTSITATELMQYYTNTYYALHSHDPNAVVAGPTEFFDDSAYDGNCFALHTVPCEMQQLQELLSAGFAKYIDAFSVHPYVTAFPPEPLTFLSSLRAQTAAVNKAAGKSLPFVGTEHGYTIYDSVDPGIRTYLNQALGAVRDPEIVADLNKALGDIRISLMMVGEGAAYDMGFYLNDFGTAPGLANTDARGFYWNLDSAYADQTDKIGPKPMAPAYAAMTKILDGSTAIGPLPGLTGTQMGYRFTRGGTTILALWDYGTTDSVVKIKKATQQPDSVCDWMGNCKNSATTDGNTSITLGAAPVYVIGTDL